MIPFHESKTLISLRWMLYDLVEENELWPSNYKAVREEKNSNQMPKYMFSEVRMSLKSHLCFPFKKILGFVSLIFLKKVHEKRRASNLEPAILNCILLIDAMTIQWLIVDFLAKINRQLLVGIISTIAFRWDSW